MDKTWIELSDDGEQVNINAYPVTIIPTRYGGAYEGAQWACFPSDTIPPFAVGNDDECQMWWEAMGNFVGLGYSPNAAYLNLNTYPEKFKMEQEKFDSDVKEEYWEGVDG